MGISVEVSGTEQLARMRAAVEKLADADLQAELLDSIGAVVESQTRRRISSEKTAPSGEKWQAWSDSYAETRHGNQSLLQGNGDLLDSIQFIVERGRVRVGSPLAYAAVHQDGFNDSVNIGTHNRLITQAFGRVLSHPVWQTVGAHKRKMNIPQRQYLGLSSDNDNELQHVIGDFWQEVLP
ncbi:phage morphogenesis protein [Salmonella enterica subsp. enterica serovar Telelkebir]|nr:phage morphogenesis protein [Salmonella enterica subsp. enterica serovar Telelkebir]ECC3295649.1 phage morphogenesis protein [Salmonella enterica subsp. enterica]EDR2888304.1 phage morphogenesis protein [Salmonella enterica subsp. enterica]EDR6140825.1 phage morphogenesis protein [Salmonella enterica subsp. enterica]EDU9860147.1 phage morphogenesis protein [Salmonella enterica subsp. enterica]